MPDSSTLLEGIPVWIDPTGTGDLVLGSADGVYFDGDRTQEPSFCVDCAPAFSKHPYVHPPPGALSARESSLGYITVSPCCDICYNLADDCCMACEENVTTSCLGAMWGAQDNSTSVPPSPMVEWTFYQAVDSEHHTPSQLHALIRELEQHQAHGALSQVHSEVLASSVDVPSCMFCVDSGASDHICSQLSLFESLDRTRSKTFRVVHGTARVTSKGVGSVLLPVVTDAGVQQVL